MLYWLAVEGARTGGVGALGDGTQAIRYAPVSVVGAGGAGALSGTVDLSAGYQASCAVLNTGDWTTETTLQSAALRLRATNSGPDPVHSTHHALNAYGEGVKGFPYMKAQLASSLPATTPPMPPFPCFFPFIPSSFCCGDSGKRNWG